MTMAQVTWLDTGCAGSYQGLEPQTLCPVKPDFLWLLALEAPMTPGSGSSGSLPCLLSPSPVPGPATLAAAAPAASLPAPLRFVSSPSCGLSLGPSQSPLAAGILCSM